ncbi:MAG: hypothetical protein JW940_05370, partial [Polyangiaceae bacterium]|nr:hypothetical protein [Polyangiaceae bacterium]
SHTVSVQPSALLEPDTECYVTIDRKAVQVNEPPWGYIGDYTSQVDGNSLHPTMWNFLTTSGEE